VAKQYAGFFLGRWQARDVVVSLERGCGCCGHQAVTASVSGTPSISRLMNGPSLSKGHTTSPALCASAAAFGLVERGAATVEADRVSIGRRAEATQDCGNRAGSGAWRAADLLGSVVGGDAEPIPIN
jgi:hypothetical protein